MDHARRQVGRRRVGPAHAEDVEVGDRLGTQTRAQHVADHAAQAGGRATVGLDRRGMVVCLDLHADVMVAVESHHARVVAEHAHAPVLGTELGTDLAGRRKHGLLEKVVVLHGAGRTNMVDRAAERFVAAVLAPGLCDGFQLDLHGIAAQTVEMIAHCVEFGGREREAAVAAELLKRGVVEAGEAHAALRERPRTAAGERAQQQRADHHVVDRLAGQQLPGKAIDLARLECWQPICAHTPHRGGPQSEERKRLPGRLCGRIGDAGTGQHVEHRRQTGNARVARSTARCTAEDGDRERFGDRIGEHRGGEAFDVGL